MSAGHEPPTAREQLLVRRAMPMVDRVATQVSRMFHGRVKPKELWALGTFGLYRAARTYRDEMSHDFADYAFRRVRDAMLAAVNVELFHERVRRAAIRGADDLAAHYRDDTWNPVEHDEADARRGLRRFFEELLAATFTAAVEEAKRAAEASPSDLDAAYRHAMDALAASLRALSDEELKLVTMVYREQRTIEEAGVLLEVSYATARRTHAKALAVLREELGKAGVDAAPTTIDAEARDILRPLVPSEDAPPEQTS